VEAVIILQRYRRAVGTPGAETCVGCESSKGRLLPSVCGHASCALWCRGLPSRRRADKLAYQGMGSACLLILQLLIAVVDDARLDM
jgi:hypothetical protein